MKTPAKLFRNETPLLLDPLIQDEEVEILLQHCLRVLKMYRCHFAKGQVEALTAQQHPHVQVVEVLVESVVRPAPPLSRWHHYLPSFVEQIGSS
eukprot:CAMPEP_0178464938 /NCGR_PEP_ID=MMETSP0689_2-20121128/51096_1 /TAXON_ID=160604 /ORGANISM="Amphidinium massartii, Strain CS-259" /LENGTH=93 /DNA_ID=CAMNT_0020091847 /DNA_START=170 /DNA_END=451 /DNA_ORIENTATION=-